MNLARLRNDVPARSMKSSKPCAMELAIWLGPAALTTFSKSAAMSAIGPASSPTICPVIPLTVIHTLSNASFIAAMALMLSSFTTWPREMASSRIFARAPGPSENNGPSSMPPLPKSLTAAAARSAGSDMRASASATISNCSVGVAALSSSNAMPRAVNFFADFSSVALPMLTDSFCMDLAKVSTSVPESFAAAP